MTTDSLLLGVSRSIRALRLLCPHLAAWRGPVVVVGRTGTGKGVLVEEIRRHLPAGIPFARIAATASRHSLLYSTLFGFLKGTFTGAQRDSRGLLAAISGGVLFLDDFQDLGDELQHYLVDITDGKPFWPIGAERPVMSQVRVIIGTQVPLEQLWRQGKLREDLFERLNGVTVQLPMLCDRRDDIPILADALLRRVVAREGRESGRISGESHSALQAHGWPRNVRELERTIERAAFAACAEGRRSLDLELAHFREAGLECEAVVHRRRRGSVPIALVVGQVRALGSMRAAADATGVTLRTVQRLMRQAQRDGGTQDLLSEA